ncbi:MAG TPA: hypothetical protein VM238_01330, partial [Phycisphaerae bacterium]|nr:hypothetical protein [Phycisphaerae bacterium]
MNAKPFAAAIAAAVCLAAVHGGAAWAETAPTPQTGIAAGYASDAGIAGDPAVIFADDFESWTD